MALELNRDKRSQRFFRYPAEYVARNILGDFLVLNNKKNTLIARIVETESYLGVDDDASHSFGGKVTPRNKIMYEEGGLIYVYLIYGKFYCFNIVVSKKNVPEAVFIRAVEPLEGIDEMKRNRGVSDLKKVTSGPCRWTQAFGINKQFLGRSIVSDEIFVARNFSKKFDIVKAKRIGVEYATNSKDMLLRFYIRDNPFISKR
ncbi:MAG: DNA-3-methyladenine glycosylase [Candidatus Omnitrophota bacterium]|nr:MAG: DNA-3-methyladenine glycosylase [Candidatus Omnitrophota bacterium]